MKVTTKVILAASITCPKCGRKLVETADTDEESLSTGNTTQRASYWMNDLKNKVQAVAQRRGWTAEMCGTCRDRDPVGIVDERAGKEQRRHVEEGSRVPRCGAR